MADGLGVGDGDCAGDFDWLLAELGAGDSPGGGVVVRIRVGDFSWLMVELGTGDCGGFGDSKRISTGN